MLGIGAIGLNSCDKPPAGPGDDLKNIPVSITWTPNQAIDGKETTFNLSVSDPDGLERVIARGLDSDFFKEYNNLSGNSLNEQITKNYELGNDSPITKRYEIIAFDKLGEEVSKINNVTIQPAAITNLPPTINIEVTYERNWQEDPIDFRIIATDDFEDIGSIRLDFGDGNINEFNVGKQAIDTVLTHQYLAGGDFNWQATAKDVLGLQDTEQGTLNITPLYDVNVLSELVTYAGSINGDIVEPDNTASMKFTSRDGTIVREFNSENGQITGRIPAGEFEVEFTSDYSKLIRMKVDRSFYPDEWQYLSFMNVDDGAPGEHSWVVRSYPENNPNYRSGDQNWYFDVNGDIDSRAQIVKGAIADQGWIGGERFIPAEELLTMMTYQIHGAGILRVPRTKDIMGEEQTQKFVYNMGNPYFDCSDWDGASERPETCPSMKLVEQGLIDPSDLPDGGVNPPGVIPRNPIQAEQSFDNYVALMKDIFNSDIVAGNPYNIEVIKGYSPELTDYLRGWYVPTSAGGVNLVSPEDNVFFTSHNMGAGTEFYNGGIAVGGAFNYTRASSMFVGLNLSGFLNEATHWFSSREGFPCVYSIRDRTSGGCNETHLDLNEFSDLDVVFNKIAVSFGTFSQKQKIYFDRQMSANGLANRDGFNTTLPRE